MKLMRCSQMREKDRNITRAELLDLSRRILEIRLRKGLTPIPNILISMRISLQKSKNILEEKLRDF